WNASTLDALRFAEETASLPRSLATDTYRSRQYFEPVVTFQVAKPISVSVGASLESFQDQVTNQVQSANAGVASVRYHQRLEGSDLLQDFDGGYDARFATRTLRSDLVYSRHRWEFRYTLAHGKQVLIEDAMGGMITGQAPLFERFVLGNSTTLRGWNKFELDPYGGNRM